MVLPISQHQWREGWRKKQSVGTVVYNTAITNSYAWAQSGFANNDIARDLCRLVSALQFTMQHSVASLWWLTYLNLLADLLSRMVDESGNFTQQGRAEFEAENNKLAQPYRILSKDELVPAVLDLVEWVGFAQHAVSELSPI